MIKTNEVDLFENRSLRSNVCKYLTIVQVIILCYHEKVRWSDRVCHKFISN